MARLKKSEYSIAEGAVRAHQGGWKAAGRCDAYSLVMWEMPHLGCDSVRHLCGIASGSNISRSGRGRKPGSRRQKNKVRRSHSDTCLRGGGIGVRWFLELGGTGLCFRPGTKVDRGDSGQTRDELPSSKNLGGSPAGERHLFLVHIAFVTMI